MAPLAPPVPPANPFFLVSCSLFFLFYCRPKLVQLPPLFFVFPFFLFVISLLAEKLLEHPLRTVFLFLFFRFFLLAEHVG